MPPCSIWKFLSIEIHFAKQISQGTATKKIARASFVSCSSTERDGTMQIWSRSPGEVPEQIRKRAPTLSGLTSNVNSEKSEVSGVYSASDGNHVVRLS